MDEHVNVGADSVTEVLNIVVTDQLVSWYSFPSFRGSNT
jgi:hypothetical protein